MRINFNKKTAKNFRKSMADYYNAINVINDIRLGKTKSKKAILTVMQSDKETIEAIINGSYNGMRTIESCRQDLKEMQSRLDAINFEIDLLTADYNKAVDRTLTLYTDDMYKAAKNIIATYGSPEAVNEWREALLSMFKSHGVCDDRVTPYDVREYDYLVTPKENTGKTMMKKGGLGISKKDKQASIFFKGLTDYMVSKNYLHPYEYKFRGEKVTNNEK